MNNTLVFGFLGILYTAIGIYTMDRPDRLRSVFEKFANSGVWLFTSSMLAFVLGILLVFIYGAMAPGLLGVMSLIGWIAIAKGFLILSAPFAFHRIMAPLMKSDIALAICSFVCYVFGLALLVASMFV